MTPQNLDIFKFDKFNLIPEEWKQNVLQGQLVFNPTLTKVAGGYAMCYRVAPPDGSFRGLAACTLNDDMELIAGSVVALSDVITYARTDGLNERALQWHADPRYQRLQGKLYITWNDGGNRPVNHQFLMEMSDDGRTPAGKARELILYGMQRRNTEKNWMLFDAGDRVHVVYSVWPHTILLADLSNPYEVPCQPAADIDWENEYSDIFGVLRGGAQPVPYTRPDGRQTFLSVVHSSFKLPEGRRYEMAVYEFSAISPFEVLRCVSKPVQLSMAGFDGFEFSPLNKEVYSVVYPCGVVLDSSDLVISYGINDENLAIARVPVSKIEAALKPVETKAINFVITPVEYKPAPDGFFGSKDHVAVPLFWWNTCEKKFDGEFGSRRFKIGNFGDIASKDIFERIGKFRTVEPEVGRRKIVSIGSVLHTARNGDVIWGSGVKGTARKMHPSVEQLDIRAVRGPLTLDFLRELKFDVGKVVEVFDPGCLVKELYAQEIASYDVARNQDMGPFRIIPHYRDDLMMRRLYQDLHHCFLTVDCTPQQMVERMLGAEAVFSSSLHGVIFAESLGIPAYWLKSIGGENDYKFYDYYYGTGRYQVKCHDTLQDAMRSKPMPLPVRRPENYLATFPHDILVGMAAENFGLSPGEEFLPVRESVQPVQNIIGWREGAGRVGTDGFWLVGKESGCGLRLSIDGKKGIDVLLTLRPFNHPNLKSPQEIDLVIAGRMKFELRWNKGEVDSRTVIIPVQPSMLEDGMLRLETFAKHAVSPASLNVGVIEDPLVACIQSIKLSEPWLQDGGLLVNVDSMVTESDEAE